MNSQLRIPSYTSPSPLAGEGRGEGVFIWSSDLSPPASRRRGKLNLGLWSFELWSPKKEVIILMEEVVILIGNFGFPVAVSLYLLVRLEGKLETLTESIHTLSEALFRR